MRLRIFHETVFRFATPTNYTIQTLRLEPRGLVGQFIEDWRVDVSADCRLASVRDPYGNLTCTFSVDGPLESLTISASGTVGTEDTAGIVRGAAERLPTSLFLRDTDLTKPNADIRALAAELASPHAGEDLATLHALMDGLHARLAEDRTKAETVHSAAETLALGKGSSQELAQVFIACCRALDIPARFSSGYVYDPDTPDASGLHGWAESYVANVGWIGFDVARDICPSETYVRLAVGLDAADAAPIRISPFGFTPVEHEGVVTVTLLPDF